jgi:hypothetical protein
MPSPTSTWTKPNRDRDASKDRQAVVRRLLVDPEAFATTLIVVAIDDYGQEVLTWHPQTIATQWADDYGVTPLRANLDKVMAAVTVLTTNYFFKSLSRFIDLCNVLSGDQFDPAEFNPADAGECAWGITEALLLHPPDEAEPFADEVRHYVAAVLKDEGFVKPPDVLRLAIGGDFSAQVQTDFADDPEMFSAIYKTQAGKADDVTAMLRDNLEELVAQLQAVPLVNGDTTDLLNRLGQHIRATEPEEEPLI